MHEFSIASQIIDTAGETAADHGADTFEGVSVAVGEASHINPDQLESCLEAAADSEVGDIDIEMTITAPYAECECGWSGEPPSLEDTLAYAPNLRCPDCDGRLELQDGEEVRITSVTVPDDTARADDQNQSPSKESNADASGEPENEAREGDTSDAETNAQSKP